MAASVFAAIARADGRLGKKAVSTFFSLSFMAPAKQFMLDCPKRIAKNSTHGPVAGLFWRPGPRCMVLVNRDAATRISLFRVPRFIEAWRPAAGFAASPT